MTNNSNKPIIKYEGIEVSPGFITNIGIIRSFYLKLPYPYGDCRDDVDIPSVSDSDFYRYTIQIGKYTRNQCYEVCFQYKYAISICKCSDPSVNSNVNNVSVCAYEKDLNCLNEQRSKFSSFYCEKDCPEECERVEYTYKVSLSKYPSEYKKKETFMFHHYYYFIPNLTFKFWI